MEREITVAKGQQLQSLVTAKGVLELSLADVEVPEPGPDEVVIRVEAAPINPSDLGLLLAGADPGTAQVDGPPDRRVVTAPLTDPALRAARGRVGHSLPVGNEGSGTVVDAGSSARAHALVGRTVAVAGGGMYAQYRTLPASMCLELPPGTDPVDGAAAFVNPLTALGMVETMRREDHTALVHTAAASNLGQMLNRLCLEDGVPLVNVVRRAEQAEMLRAAGAAQVCDSSVATFMDDLIEAVTSTSATLAFDAVGGGRLASQILTAMEVAASASAATFSRYGSSVHKQVYIYGGLDRGPTELTRGFGMAWGVGGWLLTPFLQKIGPEAAGALRQRVAAELKTTFASHYSHQVSLADALQLDNLRDYARQATGGKYLIRPQL
ncbi:MAG: zinc-binding dehydrogenase [Acidimicrobiaceae bacterium]|nr:zinc-binding dehydrogenase [Acidimicrobiaceae bacterium]